MIDPSRRWIITYQYFAGLSDTGTGLLLVSSPALTLGLMGFAIMPQPPAFVRYIGVFVLSVGLTYLWAAVRWPLREQAQTAWTTQWKITALVRTLAALFVFWQVTTRAMEGRWIGVAIFDSVLALIQWIGLDKGWLDRASSI